MQKWTTRTTCLAQERQDNLGKFTPRCKQFLSCLTSAAKATLSWPDAASSSLFLNLFKTETTGTLLPWGGFSNFLQKLQIRSRSTRISSKLACGRMLLEKADTLARRKTHQFLQVKLPYWLICNMLITKGAEGRIKNNVYRLPRVPLASLAASRSDSHSFPAGFTLRSLNFFPPSQGACSQARLPCLIPSTRNVSILLQGHNIFLI